MKKVLLLVSHTSVSLISNELLLISISLEIESSKVEYENRLYMPPLIFTLLFVIIPLTLKAKY